MYVRKEALLSSQIEGTQSSFADLLLFENQQKPHVSIDDVEEVSNYVLALNYGLQQITNGFPLSLRLIRDIHGILLQGSRGSQKLPGEFRRSQNWIGGTRPGNALFVPPPPDQVMQCMGDFEHFLHDPNVQLPLLIKVGLTHVQFETIHPFLDGNGRLGRLLITLLLCHGDMLSTPVLYVSLYLKKNRTMYYQLLQEVRTDGSWEAWLEFFLDGITISANQALTTITAINTLFDKDLANIRTLGRAQHSCINAFEYLKKVPQTNVATLAQALTITAPTARSILNHLVKLAIVQEISGKKRDKMYVYRDYLALLEEGAEPL